MLLPMPWVLAPYCIYVTSAISFKEEQVSATQIFKEQGIFISDGKCDTVSNTWFEMPV